MQVHPRVWAQHSTRAGDEERIAALVVAGHDQLDSYTHDPAASMTVGLSFIDRQMGRAAAARAPTSQLTVRSSSPARHLTGGRRASTATTPAAGVAVSRAGVSVR